MTNNEMCEHEKYISSATGLECKKCGLLKSTIDSFRPQKENKKEPTPMPTIEYQKAKVREIVGIIAQKADEPDVRKMGFPSMFLEAVEKDIMDALQTYGEERYEEGKKTKE